MAKKKTHLTEELLENPANETIRDTEDFQLLREWAKENGYGHRERYGKIIRKP